MTPEGRMNSIAKRILSKLGIGETTRRLNPAIFGAEEREEAIVGGAITRSARAIRQKHAPVLNKSEQAALEFLRRQNPGVGFVPHGLSFLLANGVRFTPDIVGDFPDRLRLYEVKAMRGRRVHVEDDAAVKIKTAAALYTSPEWIIIWYDKAICEHVTQVVKGRE